MTYFQIVTSAHNSTDKALEFASKELLAINKSKTNHGLAVRRTGERSHLTGLIRSWSRSHLTYIPGGC